MEINPDYPTTETSDMDDIELKSDYLSLPRLLNIEINPGYLTTKTSVIGGLSIYEYYRQNDFIRSVANQSFFCPKTNERLDVIDDSDLLNVIVRRTYTTRTGRRRSCRSDIYRHFLFYFERL